MTEFGPCNAGLALPFISVHLLLSIKLFAKAVIVRSTSIFSVTRPVLFSCNRYLRRRCDGHKAGMFTRLEMFC